MSQRSICVTTVTPRLLSAMSSGSVPIAMLAVSGILLGIYMMSGSTTNLNAVFTATAWSWYAVSLIALILSAIVLFSVNDFEGLEFTARGTAPEDPGADNYSIGMHAGTSFDDGRGNVNFGLSYDRSNYLRPHQRDFAASDFRMVPNPENTAPATK